MKKYYVVTNGNSLENPITKLGISFEVFNSEEEAGAKYAEIYEKECQRFKDFTHKTDEDFGKEVGEHLFLHMVGKKEFFKLLRTIVKKWEEQDPRKIQFDALEIIELIAIAA